MVYEVNVDSWAEEEELAPQQKDNSSCGVFALKVKFTRQIRNGNNK